jgi:hypothetical protein
VIRDTREETAEYASNVMRWDKEGGVVSTQVGRSERWDEMFEMSSERLGCGVMIFPFQKKPARS